MSHPHTATRAARWPDWLDPRRSLATALGWLVLMLSLGLAGMAGFWAGDITRASLLQQYDERAIGAAEQWSRGLDTLLAQRLQPLQAAAAMLPLALQLNDVARLDTVVGDLQHAYPGLLSIVLMHADGTPMVSSPHTAADAAALGWARQAAGGTWIGLDDRDPSRRSLLLAVPVSDTGRRVTGMVAARLDWAWLLAGSSRLRARIPFLNEADALLLDADGRVLIGPPTLLGQRLATETLVDESERRWAGAVSTEGGSLQRLNWIAGVRWPVAEAMRRADGKRLHIAALALAMGLVAAVIGTLLARRLTRRLSTLTRTVQALRLRSSAGIAVPPGHDEANHLGRAINELLVSLQHERTALTALTTELEQRVQSRTLEVERLAEEARYAAVTRERLRLARDLHDTLAHSMMAMLAEVRILKTLHRHDPAALAEELERAEATARDGLREARAAIEQMRTSGVRDLGLGAALQAATAQFVARTGHALNYSAGPNAANLADARAEAMLRIAEEALRNIERHAGVCKVRVELQDDGDEGVLLTIDDDGVGFDTGTRKPGHYGLVGLREQAQLIGATLKIDSTPGRGCRVSVRLGQAGGAHAPSLAAQNGVLASE